MMVVEIGSVHALINSRNAPNTHSAPAKAEKVDVKLELE
jgi:hypothetical protein